MIYSSLQKAYDNFAPEKDDEGNYILPFHGARFRLTEEWGIVDTGISSIGTNKLETMAGLCDMGRCSRLIAHRA